MKTIFTFLMLLSSFPFISAQTREQQHSEVQLLRSIQLEDECQPVIFMLSGDIEIEKWEENYIKIETTVKSLNFGENLLNYLISSGRYDIKLSTRAEDGAKMLSMPKRELIIMRNNADMEEEVSMHIYVPKFLIWELIDPRLQWAM